MLRRMVVHDPPPFRPPVEDQREAAVRRVGVARQFPGAGDDDVVAAERDGDRGRRRRACPSSRGSRTSLCSGRGLSSSRASRPCRRTSCRRFARSRPCRRRCRRGSRRRPARRGRRGWQRDPSLTTRAAAVRGTEGGAERFIDECLHARRISGPSWQLECDRSSWRAQPLIDEHDALGEVLRRRSHRLLLRARS